MVELMCRDGKTSQKDLEELANTIYYSTGIETVVIAEQDRRAMVFWGPEDVKSIVEEFNIKSIDPDDTELCDTIVAAAEPKIHQAMIAAGNDVLIDEVCDTAESMGEQIDFGQSENLPFDDFDVPPEQ
jgi:hypothetical protein